MLPQERCFAMANENGKRFIPPSKWLFEDRPHDENIVLVLGYENEKQTHPIMRGRDKNGIKTYEAKEAGHYVPGYFTEELLVLYPDWKLEED